MNANNADSVATVPGDIASVSDEPTVPTIPPKRKARGRKAKKPTSTQSTQPQTTQANKKVRLQKESVAAALMNKILDEDDERAPGYLSVRQLPASIHAVIDTYIATGHVPFRVGKLIGEGEGARVSVACDPNNSKNPLIMPSPFGPLAVVVKEFDEIDEDGQWIVTDTRKGDILHVCDWHSDAKDWVKTHLGKTANIDVSFARTIEHEGGKRVSSTEFVNEIVMNGLATSVLQQGLTPHVVACTGALVEEGEGNIFVELVTNTFERFVSHKNTNRWLTSSHLAAFYVQMLHTLDVLQRTLQFKHHDLHSDNLFVEDIRGSDKVYNGVKLSDVTHFRYHLDDGTCLTIPSCGYMIKFGDFGFASATDPTSGTRFHRIDIDMFNDKVRTWGSWSQQLEGEHGYDMQVFWAVSPIRGKCKVGGKTQTRRLHRRIQAAIVGKDKDSDGDRDFAKRTTMHHRPSATGVSDVTPMQVLKSVFAKDPEEWFDFRGADVVAGRVVMDINMPR